MKFVFSRQADGMIDAAIEPDSPVLNHALQDSVSSRAPRGAIRPGLSAYWIERTAERGRHAEANRSTEPFATGNVTYLRLEGNQVIAGYDFDTEEDDAESMPLSAFHQLLQQWRDAVIEAGGSYGEEAIPRPLAEPPHPMGPAS